MGRAPCCDKANVKKGPWSPEEDAKLKTYIEQYGTGGNWIALPQKIGLKRCGKSCRLRWLNYLRPNIKHGGFSEEEDSIICNLYVSIGSRWSVIAAQLPGRTDNDIKNYWNTRLKKKLLGKRKQCHVNRLSMAGQDPKDATGVEDSPFSQALSNSALERLQLHMQLQNLQHPFAFYNNPVLWPRLQPLQEKLIQNLQDGNELLSSEIQQNLPSSEQLGQGERAGICEPPVAQDYQKMKNPKADEFFEKSLNGLPSLDSSMGLNRENMVRAPPTMSKLEGAERPNIGLQAAFQADFDEFLDNKVVGFLPQEEQTMCEIYGPKDSLAWWSNDSYARPASSYSWDSSSAFQFEGLFQDYALGYNMQI